MLRLDEVDAARLAELVTDARSGAGVPVLQQTAGRAG